MYKIPPRRLLMMAEAGRIQVCLNISSNLHYFNRCYCNNNMAVSGSTVLNASNLTCRSKHFALQIKELTLSVTIATYITGSPDGNAGTTWPVTSPKSRSLQQWRFFASADVSRRNKLCSVAQNWLYGAECVSMATLQDISILNLH
jgi:hypothetical protein